MTVAGKSNIDMSGGDGINGSSSRRNTGGRGGGSSNSSSDIGTLIVIFIIAAIILVYLYNNNSEVELVKSNLDNRTYLVRNLSNKRKAADILARLNQKLITLVRHTMAKYGKNNSEVTFLYRNFDPNNISEGGIEHGYTSFSINKGEKIVMCIRQKDREYSFVDENLLVYVAVHELAHLMTHAVGHSHDFWANFKFLLKEAVAIGIYTKVDYSRHPKDYCGIRISSSII